jgi:uncharacterized protein YdhG (YjbR/CyaY superfamily)
MHPNSIDEYIAFSPLSVQPILHKIRQTVRSAAPIAAEVISYRMPAFRLHGILIYFAAFGKHIGLYPPVSGDNALMKELRRYAGPKGNLKFPLDKPIPYGLIRKIVRLRVKQDVERVLARRDK